MLFDVLIWVRIVVFVGFVVGSVLSFLIILIW